MTVVRAFHAANGLPIGEHPRGRDQATTRSCMRALDAAEVLARAQLSALLYATDYAAYLEALGGLLIALAHLRYSAESVAVTYGLPIDEAFVEVHRAAMSGDTPDPTKFVHLIEGGCEDEADHAT